MKLTEITKTHDQLFEAINSVNDTGINTEVLVEIARSRRENHWISVDSDDLIARISAGTAPWQ